MTDYKKLLDNHNILSEVQQLIQENQKVAAIKLIKDKTGLGLKECKDVVDALGKGYISSKDLSGSKKRISVDEVLKNHHIENQLTSLLQQNSKLEAIKLVIDHTGMGLLDAKNFVESIQNNQDSFTQENIDEFSNISVKVTNNNGRISVKMKEGKNPEKVIYPNDPNWSKVKSIMGNKPELLQYENDFLSGKHYAAQKKNSLFVETSSYGKWIFLLVLFCVIMLLIYFYDSKN